MVSRPPGRARSEAGGDVARILILAVLAVCAFLTVVLTALLMYPFSPYTVYATHLIPTLTCPAQEVRVRGDSKIASGWDLRRIETESIWRPTGESGAESGDTGVILKPKARERSVVVSSITRTAPSAPGTYTLLTDAKVYGTYGKKNVFHGFPKVQRLTYGSEDTLTVLPESAKECR